MSTRKILALTIVLVFALSVPAFAATPWVTVTNPDPAMVWQASTSTMVPNTDLLTVWEIGGRDYYMVVWDFDGLAGNVRIELLKDSVVVSTLSPPGGTPIGANGKGDQKTYASAWPGPGTYKVRVTSIETGISDTSAPFKIVSKQ
jgi:hypothetical protein